MNVNYGRDQHITYGGTTIVNDNPSNLGLEKLATQVAFSALHDAKSRGPRARCLEGTMKGVIEILSDWIESPDSGKLCWFHGGAGVGKSAVAQTICEKYLHSRLAASFFYSRNGSSRDTLDSFIPTIAYQLATNSAFEGTNLASQIDRIICSKPGIFDMKWDDQFEWLIREPLARLKSEKGNKIESKKRNRLPSLIVIDGLDECMGLERASNASEAQETLLSIIQNVTLANPSIPLRFLILSRPEHIIRNFFRSTPSKPGPMHKQLDMRDFRAEADRDIRLFLEKEFAALPDLHPEAMIKPGWPGDEIILRLVRKSDGHFIYVVTAMKYISQRNDPELKLPQQRLAIILQTNKTSLYPDLSDLDQLYHHILRPFLAVREQMLLPILQLLVTGHHRPIDDSYPGRATDFQIPWRSQHAIARILDVDPAQVAMVLSRLHSVFKVSDNENSSVSFLHASFSDFLIDNRRSHDFHVRPIDRFTYFNILSRLLLPILIDITHRYHSGENRVQLADWTTKIEIWSTNVWTLVEKALVPEASAQSALQDYIPSDVLISAMNKFDIFQYVNMLLDRKYMEPVNAIQLYERDRTEQRSTLGALWANQAPPPSRVTRGNSAWLLPVNVWSLSIIHEHHSKSDSPLKDKLRPFLGMLKAFFEGDWVAIFPKGPDIRIHLLQLTPLMIRGGSNEDYCLLLDALEWEDRMKFLKVFPQGTNLLTDQQNLENQCITAQQRQAFAMTIAKLSRPLRVDEERIKDLITTTLLYEKEQPLGAIRILRAMINHLLCCR